LLTCENDPPTKYSKVPAPQCLESGLNCSSKEDLAEFQKFAKAVDTSLADDLKEIKKARETFSRRSCDFLYAEFANKGEVLHNTYGPKGPLLPGGSYLFEMRRWADAAFMLHRACNRAPGGCQSLLQYLKEHPEEDLAPNGIHGKAGSNVYTELRKACEVGRSRAPVPNDGPVWCDMETGLCEQKSCKKWWRKLHSGKNVPWVDDRAEYEDLIQACDWIHQITPSSQELNKYQLAVQADTLDDKINFCRPRWINGYCERTIDRPRYAQCTMQDGKWCKHGKVFENSDLDDTAGWKEPFKEKPVTVEKALMSPLLTLATPPTLAFATRSGHPVVGRRRADESQGKSFL